MDKIKVIMVDDNIGLVEMVEEYFNESKSIKLVNKAYDGIEGIDLIEKERGNYDVIILDLIMLVFFMIFFLKIMNLLQIKTMIN